MKRTILVIEDEKVTRDNLLKFLTSEGFNAIGAENGKIGVDLATSNLPDLIICDILMPEMDGYDVLLHLEQNPSTNGIPFIFLTVTNEQDFFADNELFNQDDYLRKPVTSEKLRNAIASKISARESELEEYSLESELEKLTEKLYKLEEYSQIKDNLLDSLCENLRKYLPSLNKELKKINTIQTTQEKNESITKLNQDFISMLSLINQVSELQKIITTENYKLLDQFDILK